MKRKLSLVAIGIVISLFAIPFYASAATLTIIDGVMAASPPRANAVDNNVTTYALMRLNSPDYLQISGIEAGKTYKVHVATDDGSTTSARLIFQTSTNVLIDDYLSIPATATRSITSFVAPVGAARMLIQNYTYAGPQPTAAIRIYEVEEGISFSGGLLDGLPMFVATNVSNASTGDLRLTDNNESSGYNFGSSTFYAWRSLTETTTITGVRVKATGSPRIIYYDADGVPIKAEVIPSDGSLFATNVPNVRKVAFTQATGSVHFWEVNVYGSTTPPDTTPPAAPINLTATGQVGQILLDWGDVPDAAFYKVYRNGTQVASGIIASTWTDTGVTDGVTYSYEVTAVDAADNESPRSAAATAETAEVLDEIPPATPTGVTTTPGDGQIHVTWDANTDDATGYNVYVNGVKGNTTPITTPSANLTGLNNGQTYQVQVSAVDAAGNESPRSAPVNVTPFGALVPPNDVKAIPKNAQVEIKWAAVPGATGYRIYRNGTLIGTTTTETRYVDTTVTNDTMYEYTVTSTGDGGESAPSEVKSARPGNIIVIEPDAPLFGGLMGVLETGWSFLKKFGGYVAIVLAILFAPTILSFVVWLFRKLSPSKAAKKAEAGGKKHSKQRKQLTPEEKERRARERRLNKARDDKYDQLTRMGRISERDKWAREVKYMNREQREAKAREERNRKSREQRAASSGGGRTQRSGRSSRRGR